MTTLAATAAQPTAAGLARAAAGPTSTRAPATAPVLATATASALETPLPTASVAPTETSPPPTATATYAAHVVQSGETLLGIGVRYGLSLEELLVANVGVQPAVLQVGQVINIPPPPAFTPIPLSERDYGYMIVGYSVLGRAIEAFSFGEGAQQVLFVGGIHGGYEWNTVLLAYEIIDTLNGNRDLIPPGVTVTIIPVANPDGLLRVTGSAGRFFPEQVAADTTPGRFNANDVDLNRNFGCDWRAAAVWGTRSVYPGSEPFSEPEARALRDFVSSRAPRAVVFWHSAAGGLASSGICGGEDAGSGAVAQAYAAAANYSSGPFTAYALSGTASDWFVSQGVPAIEVELITHHSTEYGRNLEGVLAVLALVSEAVEGE